MKSILLSLPLALATSPALPAQSASVHVPMEDGTRIAVDVYLPEAVALESDDVRVPTLLELTRYWRSSEDTRGAPRNALQPLDHFFLENGYALLKVDVRGTGASFGSRDMEYGRQEVRDGYDVVQWVVEQPWSDGTVGAFGTSYSGTTADLLAATGHPAIKAVIPGWSDFDLYRSPGRPYGLSVEFVQRWGTLVGWMDANDASQLGGTVRRVDGDSEGVLRAAAVAEHAANVDVDEAARANVFRDDAFGDGEDTWGHGSSIHWRSETEKAGVPMLVLASWLDAGTAEGALLRYANFSNPQKVVILASNHGGAFHASPFVVGGRASAPVPALEEQMELRLAFFEHHLRGVDNGVEDWPGIRYFHLGAEEFRETEVWPPAGVRRERFYFRDAGLLALEPPPHDAEAEAWDLYDVDFGASTGAANRWWTQMGGPVLSLDDRGEMDARMLTYTSEPLEEDLELTGWPSVTLHVTSSVTDGAFLVYLEDVAPDGRSRYLTEGGLRALHRAIDPDPDFPREAERLPFHSFERADVAPLFPGEPTELRLRMWPTSVRIAAGHRLRVAIAGADRGTFERLPAEGTPRIGVSRGASGLSFVELPVVRD